MLLGPEHAPPSYPACVPVTAKHVKTSRGTENGAETGKLDVHLQQDRHLFSGQHLQVNKFYIYIIYLGYQGASIKSAHRFAYSRPLAVMSSSCNYGAADQEFATLPYLRWSIGNSCLRTVEFEPSAAMTTSAVNSTVSWPPSPSNFCTVTVTED